MKILFISPEYNQRGGTQRSIYMLSKILSESDTVDILTSKIDRGLTLPVGVIKIPGFPRLQPLKFLWFRSIASGYLRIRSLINGKYDIIHSTSADTSMANIVTAHFCMKKYYLLRETVVYKSQHRQEYLFPHKLSTAWFLKMVSYLEGQTFLNPRTEQIIAVSQSLKRDLVEEYNVSPGKIEVIYDGVDTERFCPRDNVNLRHRVLENLGIKGNPVLILFVGGDWERKGLFYLINALHGLGKNNVYLLVVGAGDPGAYQPLLTTVNKIRTSVFFIPFDDSIENWYNVADIFVLPSLYEPFGMAALEAMASGLPVITSVHAGVNEIIQDDVDGIILKDPQNLDEFTSRLAELIDDPQKRETMGLQAREKSLKYTWHRITMQTRSIYLRLLQEDN